MGSRNSVPDTFYFRIIIDQTKALQRATSKKKKKKKKKKEKGKSEFGALNHKGHEARCDDMKDKKTR